jgi:hypothetical protein
VEHPTGSQSPLVGESSRTVEERVGSSGTTNQHTIEQQHEEPAPTAEAPSAASSGIIGVVVVDKSGTVAEPPN